MRKEVAVPVYYFTVITRGGPIVDEEGTELPSLEAARVEAIKDARSLMSAAVLDGRDISSRHVEIHDGNGAVLLSVAFTDAVAPDY